MNPTHTPTPTRSRRRLRWSVWPAAWSRRVEEHSGVLQRLQWLAPPLAPASRAPRRARRGGPAARAPSRAHARCAPPSPIGRRGGEPPVRPRLPRPPLQCWPGTALPAPNGQRWTAMRPEQRWRGSGPPAMARAWSDGTDAALARLQRLLDLQSVQGTGTPLHAAPLPLRGPPTPRRRLRDGQQRCCLPRCLASHTTAHSDSIFAAGRPCCCCGLLPAASDL
jgi:hypothetical protein